MKLVDLSPRWIGLFPADRGIFRIGVTFLCPHCQTQMLGVYFNPPIDPENLVEKYGWEYPKMTNQSHIWERLGETFETLSLHPSVDVSAHGHGHGCIINGEIQ